MSDAAGEAASSADKETARRKYDAIAGAYSSRYADPRAIARRQVELVERWGRRIPRGATILEVGCADGLVTEALAGAGHRVTALDLSPAMVETARRRLERAGLEANLADADVDDLIGLDGLAGPFDVVVAVMWTFFAYTSDAAAALGQLAALARWKLLVDANPRVVRPAAACSAVAAAGFGRVSWRPFLVPQRWRLPAPVLRSLAVAERVPGVRSAPLRWRANVVVKGERS